jgi:23S rRNA (guanine2445-N2)-methyltransferase
MFLYQQTRTYFAQIAEGFDALACDELTALGATRIQAAYRGLHFAADPQTLYRVIYQSRLVSRILAPLATFACHDRDGLYGGAKDIPWPALFGVDHTFGVLANVSGNDNLRHSKFAALCVKDAVADRFRDGSGQRPNVDKSSPDVWIHLHLHGQQATISLDASGGALHRRGFRQATTRAPMKETLAAAMVALSGWQGERPLYDPMCGSGTLLCEALMAAARIPSGYLRKAFGFFHLPDFDARLWQKVKTRADAGLRALAPGSLAGSDQEIRAVRAAQSNCRMLPGGRAVRVTRKAFQDIDKLENHVILCNPPYGLRLQPDQQLGDFYKALGDFLKQRCKGSEAYLFFGNREMIKRIGLKPAWKKPMRNAGLDGRVVKFELY